jgi:hypothetical protein
LPFAEGPALAAAISSIVIGLSPAYGGASSAPVVNQRSLIDLVGPADWRRRG